MKLINTEFDHRRIDDSIFDKKGRVRPSRKKFNTLEAVDFEDAENALESLVGHAYYDERNYHPAKQGMRKRFRHKTCFVDWWDERPGGSGNYEWHNFHNRLYGLIDKFIGKKFNDCFVALKERYMTNKDWRRQACGIGNRKAKRTNLWMGIRDQFLSCFEYRPRWTEYYGGYYVDEDGLIQKAPSKPKHPNRDIRQYEGEVYYVPNFGAIKNCADKLADARIDISECTLPTKVSVEFIQRWESCFRTLSYWQIRHLRESCFTYVDNRTIKTIKWHSKEWYAIKGRSGKRKAKKPDNSAYYDRSLWVQNFMKKHEDKGFTFHRLMENDPEELRWNDYLDVAQDMFDHPTSDIVVWGKKAYYQNIRDFVNSLEFVKLCKEPMWDPDFQFKYALRDYIERQVLRMARTHKSNPVSERFLATTPTS